MVKLANITTKPNLVGFLGTALKSLEKDRPLVWNKLLAYSRLDAMTARDAVSGGTASPELVIAKLDESWIGAFFPEAPHQICLSEEVAARFEKEPGNPRAQLVVLAVVLHELVHWGDNRSPNPERSFGMNDRGKRFERDAFPGEEIDFWWDGAARSSFATDMHFTDFGTAPTVPGAAASSTTPAAGGAPAPPAAAAAPFAEPTAVGDAPFAYAPSSAVAWPIETDHENRLVVSYASVGGVQFGDPVRAFYARRHDDQDGLPGLDRHHVGVDLYGRTGEYVRACENGVIVNIHPFLKPTVALLVRCESGLVINYGEVAEGSSKELGLEIGSPVAAGQRIARIGATAMCHFEIYTGKTTQTARWPWGEPRPTNVLNPTRYLLNLARASAGKPAPGV